MMANNKEDLEAAERRFEKLMATAQKTEKEEPGLLDSFVNFAEGLLEC